MVQSLIQRIRENKLDALYLFINESLRDRNQFDVFFHNLMVVLPNNWSINRVEIGHEFLSRTVFADQQLAGQADGDNNNENIEAESLNEVNNSKQDQLFRWICSLESLRSLIISDGYIPRKDHGFLNTKAVLRNLPRANNLQYLDIQRLKLRITGDDLENNDAELLAESLDSLRDSLEDLRLPAISLWGTTTSTTKEMKSEDDNDQSNVCHDSQCSLEKAPQNYPLDPLMRVCGEMTNLQLLAISCANFCESRSDNGEDQQHDGDGNREEIIRDEESRREGNSVKRPKIKLLSSKSCLISREVLLQLCRSSSTLQELALRSMRIDDHMCRTIAKALNPPGYTNTSRISLVPSSSSLSLMCSDSEQDNDDEFASDVMDMNDASDQHSPSFWTSLDLRQNPSIGTAGYEAILSSLERNCDLWCSLMVDNDSFQSRFNALIELNQANRGALVRSPTPEKLAVFLERLKDDPTALWYFLTIHRDSILHPLVRFMKWKNAIEEKNRNNTERSRAVVADSVLSREQQQQLLQAHGQNQESGRKRTSEALVLPSPSVCVPSYQNDALASFPDVGRLNSNQVDQKRGDEADDQSKQQNIKRPRKSEAASR